MINKDDELLDKMKAKEENNNRYLLHLEIVLGVISVISFLVIFIKKDRPYASNRNKEKQDP